ncbi:hypothetical protein HNP77_001136 [Treponema rectale]|uniref:Outer membrane protein beta-barrel domain-containing protein n=1 Tax=Treponema rectale TaxID=744512 RepID=A0A840SAM2_9SPIR|nr:hypothetical protein [Treponema rectale]MBB5218767.1 hypothetical protein [Treponema rectale]
MNKKFFILAFLVSLAAVNSYAYDFGFRAEAGVDVSLMNFYTYEDVSFKIQSDNRVGFEAGVRLMENYRYVPHLYTNPFIQLDVKNWYLGGGLMLPSTLQDSSDILWFARTGVMVGNWNIGRGTAAIDIGFEISPTVYIADTDDGLGDVLGTFFGTLFNIPKLNIGFSYYFPMKDSRKKTVKAPEPVETPVAELEAGGSAE